VVMVFVKWKKRKPMDAEYVEFSTGARRKASPAALHLQRFSIHAGYNWSMHIRSQFHALKGSLTVSLTWQKFHVNMYADILMLVFSFE
jgi:hypothetical protein